MSLFNILEIAGSAMQAQSEKINVIASNLANIDSVVEKNGKFYPYLAKQVIFKFNPVKNSMVGGVKVASIINNPQPTQIVYDPDNPLSNKKGYILKSNVNPITEMVNHITASRNYQANIEVVKTAKSMIMKTLSIGE
ncbi:flagellar basal body rod protein FlgC [Buchnera aphidicola (Melanaphis sacchari)]|uniref:Flagellar basal-body rod protein FlgC n=1 Tax=Buchnera aphidicola (Melanaphis sacchari) TaxID=2173854 RepID=A0A2U8DF64_9GAMM|nr:flagellar basal body rod protein FlgC [Buchnera aphidicola]AWH90456.1 flagellar basal body rod protein FlgC [Buchnera aphidicola (Melanaphis sacchari)]